MRTVPLIFFMTCLFSACTSENDFAVLPAPSEVGSHQMGFFLNNETWIPKDKGYHKDFELPIPSIDENGLVKISATRIDEGNHCRNWFCIEVLNSELKTGTFPISNETCKNVYQTYYYGDNKNLPSLTYDIIQSEKNEINFTKIDLEENIIAGFFSFKAVSNLSDTIVVSQGRFDLKLKE